ncbi:MAG TPA: cation diffusion facilitator family transporter [candidate division Zixibacteria bacterium]
MSEHTHSHNQQLASNRKALIVALSITLIMTVVEVVGGILSNSLALLGDAGHMLTDSLALGLSLLAVQMCCKPPDSKRTYGYYRTEILVALLNGLTLALISFYIFYQAYNRFTNPPQVRAPLMLVVATIGLIANLLGILVLRRGSQENLNVKGAFLHILGDTLSSVGVIVGGIIIYFTNFYLADPIIAVLIGLIILKGAMGLLFQSTDILLEAVPKHLNLEFIKSELEKMEGIKGVHDIHIWTITSGIYALSGHLFIDDQMISKTKQILENVNQLLKEKFRISHTTLQIECTECNQLSVCSLNERI